MTERYTPSEVEFRVLDTHTNTIVRDCSKYCAVVERHDGIGRVWFNREGLKCLMFTGVKSPAGTKIYDGDILEAMVRTNRGAEKFTDAVYWRDGGWRFGTFAGQLSDFAIIAVVGNRFETKWPVERLGV